MAAKMKMIAPLRMFMRTRAIQREGFICAQCRFYAAEASSPQPPSSPLLAQLRTDLKTAMRAKDTSRLNVIRALLAEVTNAAKTSKPVETDLHVLSLLNKRIAAAKEAGKSFKEAGREDLSEQENAQAKIMEDYASKVDTVSEAEMKQAVEQALSSSDAKSSNVGAIMKLLTGTDGALAGRPVVNKDLVKIITDALKSRS
jgi:uncharacterized protein YqeY